MHNRIARRPHKQATRLPKREPIRRRDRKPQRRQAATRRRKREGTPATSQARGQSQKRGSARKAAPTETLRFLAALFAPSDTALFRPIETWDEAGKKYSAADRDGELYLRLGVENQGDSLKWSNERIESFVGIQVARSAKTSANVFFGVCPRFGGGGGYDRAWQIRVVRGLWCDIDNIEVDEALALCKSAGLPLPSMVVNSGHGVHLYWLLDTPYLIDDAGDPPAVETEWIDDAAGKRRRLQFYIGPEGQRNDLSRPYLAPSLSTKAQRIQDVLQGIAASISGDHAFDLARLLRLPGTLNRKDERNGRTPVPCKLHRCDPGLRYPFETFAGFATKSPAAQKREKLGKVGLPAKRKLSAKSSDRLSELVAICDATDMGCRSDADFALCCWCVEHGSSSAEVWKQVQNVGKFAEAGQRYFERTWAAAEHHTRKKIHIRAEKQAPKPADSNGFALQEPEDVGLIKFLADLICAFHHFAKDAGGRLYIFESGVYRPIGEKFIRAQVKRLAIQHDRTAKWRPALADGVVEYIAVDAPELLQKPPAGLINLTNGLLRVADRKLLPHTPRHLSSVQLPVAFDPGAKCPDIDKFIGQVFPADARDLAFEIPAFLMFPDGAIQKSLLCIGVGANGKSVYLTLLATFLGGENVCSVMLHRLESDRFSTARLLGKLANICADLPSERLAGTSMFKAITGGDSIHAEYKFRDGFDFVPFARLVFSANHLPQSPDASEAFFRRWLIVPFDRTFRPDQQIPRDVLDARLSTPKELSGLLNRALDAIPRLRSQGGFSEPASVRQALEEYRVITDPVSAWLDRATSESSAGLAEKNSLLQAYNADAENNRRPPQTAKAFGSALHRLRPNVKDAQRRVGNKRVWCYCGIRLNK